MMAKIGPIAKDTLLEPERLAVRANDWDQSDRGLSSGRAAISLQSRRRIHGRNRNYASITRNALAPREPSIHGAAKAPRTKPPEPKLKPVPEAAVAAVGDTLREQGLAVPAVGGGTAYLQAKTANEVLKAQEQRIRLQKLKGELIERARALSLVFRLARE
jgi:hypothetical protein